MNAKLLLSSCAALAFVAAFQAPAHAGTLDEQTARYESDYDGTVATKRPAAWGGLKSDTANDDWQSVPLVDIDNAASAVVAAPVETQEGATVGEVRHVVTDRDGKARAVILEASGDDRLVEIDAGQFVYEPDRNVLVTYLSTDEIDDLP